MNWIFYLLEANLYLCVFYLFYCLLLKRETYYSLNRWYLLLTAVVAFLLPLISIEKVTQQAAQAGDHFKYNDILPAKNQLTEKAAVVSRTIIDNHQWTINDLILPVYLAVFTLFLFAIIKGICSIIRLYHNSEKFKKKYITHVMLKREQEAFSFFNWLFYHPDIRPNQAILAHEMAHINQKHSADLLLFELLRAVSWFNPILLLIIKDVKINHEFIADEIAAERASDKYTYAQLLICYAGALPVYPLAHAIFNPGQLEQRIDNLSKKRSEPKQRFKLLAVVPLFAALFICSAFTVHKNYDLFKFQILTGNSVEGKHTLNTKKPDLKISATGTSLKKKENLPEAKVVTQTPGTLILGEPDLPKTPNGKKPLASDYLMKWTENESNNLIRKPRHSIFSGTEAQLFRGYIADTLYVDKGYYELSGNQITVKTDHVMVGKPDSNENTSKKLVVIDAKTGNFLHVLTTVDVKTTASIHAVIPYKEGGQHIIKYKMMSYNARVREATITGNDIITNESDTPNAPYQPDIIW